MIRSAAIFLAAAGLSGVMNLLTIRVLLSVPPERRWPIWHWLLPTAWVFVALCAALTVFWASQLIR